MPEPYFITTPIYYVNDKPHIGHAYTTLACDVLARFQRLMGRRVLFLTGTDEHGQKVEQSAAKAGMTPQAFTDAVSANFRDLAQQLNISNDQFIRTTEPRHIRAAQALWETLVANNQIYLGSYAGWYSVRDEAFYQESELVDGKAPTGAPVEWVEEPSYFFRLSAWQEPLLHLYREHPDFIAPQSRRNEVMRFVEGGLKDLSVSRTSFRWGVPVPGDEKHILYVWLDALTNYLTAVGYPDQHAPDYQAFWPAALHMVGKDILRFHAVYWPAFLMAANLPVPQRVFAHGWWTNEGQKISKSLGNVIDPLELIQTYGLDQVRYFLMREVPFGQDGDFSRAAMVRRINQDLANDIGNLCQRVLSQIQKNCGAAVPAPGAFSTEDTALLAQSAALLATINALLNEQAFHKALEAISELTGAANRYIDTQAPWTLKKTDPARMATVLYVLAEVARRLGLMLLPFMPESAGKMLDQLAIPADARDYRAWDHMLVAGTALPAPQGVFPRYVEGVAAS
jgi:methionyl-tRNA synthetase